MKSSNKKRLFELMDKLNSPQKPERIDEIISKNPIDLPNIKSSELDKEILRLSIIAEYDAINLYEQFANKCKNNKLKKILSDVAKEEKTHIGEFEAMLNILDKEQKVESKKGEKEIKTI